MIVKVVNTLREGYRLLSLPCSEASRWISQSMDGPLPLSQRLAVRLHLVVCKLCRRYRQHLVWMRRAMRRFSDRLAEEPATVRLPESARARMKATLREVTSDESDGPEDRSE